MKLSLHKILVLGLCLFVGACAFKKEDAEDKQRQELADVLAKKLSETNELKLTEDNVSVRFDYGELGHYTLTISWPESIGTMEVFIDGSPRASVSGPNRYQEDIVSKDTIQIELRAYSTPAQGRHLISEFKKSYTVETPEFEMDVKEEYLLTRNEVLTCKLETVIKAPLNETDSQEIITTEINNFNRVVRYSSDEKYKIVKASGTMMRKTTTIFSTDPNTKRERETAFSINSTTKLNIQSGQNGTVTTKSNSSSTIECIGKPCLWDKNSKSLKSSESLNQIRVVTEKIIGNKSYVIAEEINGQRLDVAHIVDTKIIDGNKTIESSSLIKPTNFHDAYYTQYEQLCTTTIVP